MNYTKRAGIGTGAGVGAGVGGALGALVGSLIQAGYIGLISLHQALR